MNLKHKIREIIREANNIRISIDKLETLMDDEVMGWAECKQDEWPEEWALQIINLQNSVKHYATNIPTLDYPPQIGVGNEE